MQSWHLIYSISLVRRLFLVITHEELVALLVHFSVKRVTTASLRRVSLATSSVSESHSRTAQIRSEYGVIPYSVQHCAIAE